MIEHTPGPWWVTDSGVRDSGGYICHTNAATHYPGQDGRYERETTERAANKHLIAAAPDLLEALQDVVAFWDSITMEDSVNDKHVKARAAIAKALCR